MKGNEHLIRKVCWGGGEGGQGASLAKETACGKTQRFETALRELVVSMMSPPKYFLIHGTYECDLTWKVILEDGSKLRISR